MIVGEEQETIGWVHGCSTRTDPPRLVIAKVPDGADSIFHSLGSIRNTLYGIRFSLFFVDQFPKEQDPGGANPSE
jgi:hypothetical protein